ncbi:ATP-binding protein [Picosynechococcus sp. PCC 11901]|uniref:ATP-binding protein n=1 Tax=Picosynechococcus sp. PCC 11901 TaxID=2579791 RepID=UPI0037C656D2
MSTPRQFDCQCYSVHPVGGIITLTLRRQSREILVEVADTGVGIPLADQKYIFDRFYRCMQTVPSIPEVQV